MRRTLFWLVTALVLVLPNRAIFQKEKLLSSGTTMLLELAPVDPRSLIQGDYMRLAYAIVRDTGSLPETLPSDGHLVVELDKNQVAHFKRIYDPKGPTLAEGEHLLQYRKRGFTIRLGAESFFFQEGHASYYEKAKYGELRVSNSGESVLVGLRGQNFEQLGPDKH
jgi:uncharacterized membrane-anchored protein